MSGRGVAAPGFRVLMVTNMFPRDDDPLRGPFVKRQVDAVNRLLPQPVRVVVVGRSGAGGLVASRRVVRDAIAAFAPDVVHVYYGLSGIAVPWPGRARIVLTLCGSDLLRARHRPGPKGVLEYAVSVATAWRASTVLVQSSVMRDALPFDALRRRTTVLPTGIDLERFRPLDRREARHRLGWGDDAFVVLFPAGPSRPVKRFALARAAVERLRASCPGARVELRTLGEVPPAEVPWHINAADCTLITSEWEAGPIVFSESVACGVPVVTVPVGYARTPGLCSTHVLVRAARAEALAEALRGVLETRLPHARPADLALDSEEGYAARLADVYRCAVSEIRRGET